MIKELSQKWIAAKEQEKKANEERLRVEIELYKAVMEQTEINKEGSTTLSDLVNGFKITITSGMNVAVDQAKAINAPYLFKTKFEYSKTVLKDLPAEMQDQVHDYITIKPSKPTFSVSKL